MNSLDYDISKEIDVCESCMNGKICRSVPTLTASTTTKQLKWSCFINTHDAAGDNISWNLHMNHLNNVSIVAVEGLYRSEQIRTASRNFFM